MYPKKQALFISCHGDPLASLGGIQSGGQNVYVRELSLALEERGWGVDVLTHWDDPRQERIQKLGRFGKVIRVSAGHKGFVEKDDLYNMLPAFLSEAKGVINENNGRYSVIHSNYWLSGWIGMGLKRALNVPQVHTSHSLGLVKVKSQSYTSPILPTRVRVEKTVFENVDALIATSPVEKQILEKEYGVRPDTIHVVPCGIREEVFSPANPETRKKSRLELGLGRKAMILYVGRLEPAKGIEVLLRAVATVIDSLPKRERHVQVWIAGGDPRDLEEGRKTAHRRRYEKLAADLGLTDCVHFLGPVKQHALPRYYRAADLCVVPSYYESFGLVAVEAMACGCPVVASQVGGLRFTVEDGKTGLLVPPRDVGALASAIRTLIRQPDLREQLGNLAAKRVRERFTWGRVAEDVANVYERVMACATRAVTTVSLRASSS